MRIYIMTDMEGVAGVVDFANWVEKDGRYYDEGKKLLTEEINACINGFCAACEKKGETVEEILVVDGHGYGGIDVAMLDKRASYSRGWHGPFPFEKDERFDCGAVIGQHARAGTPYSHLGHTGMPNTLYMKINGIEVGEYGEEALLASQYGFPVIFASGEKALEIEVKELTPWVHTAAVKEGVTPGKGDECTNEQYEVRNLSAIHLSPAKARALIREKSEIAMTDFIENKEKFELVKLEPPFVMERRYRSIKGEPPFTLRSESMKSLASALNGENRVKLD